MTEDASRYLKKKNVAVSPHGNAKLAVNMSIKQTSHDEDLPPEYLRAQRNNYCT